MADSGGHGTLPYSVACGDFDFNFFSTDVHVGFPFSIVFLAHLNGAELGNLEGRVRMSSSPREI